MRRIVTRLLIVLGSILIALIIAEVAVRALDLGPATPMASAGKGPVQDISDPDLRWEPRPNSNRKWTYFDRGAENPRVVRAHVNRHGARGKALAKKKPEGVYRILAIGDSFTFGTGVGNLGTWPAGLQRRLDREARLGKIEVWNFGVEGYDSLQEIAFLKKKLLEFEPDMVVVAFFFNDVEDGSRKAPPLAGWRKTAMIFCKDEPAGFAKFLRDNSMLARTAADRLGRKILTGNWTRKVTQLFVDGHSGWERVKGAMIEGSELGKEHGFEFVVALYPPLWREGEHLASHEVYEVFTDFLETESIPGLNLNLALEDRNVEAFWVHRRNHHPNAECHQIIANALGDFLVEEELIPVSAQ